MRLSGIRTPHLGVSAVIFSNRKDCSAEPGTTRIWPSHVDDGTETSWPATSSPTRVSAAAGSFAPWHPACAHDGAKIRS
jgi:hypothetical protein